MSHGSSVEPIQIDQYMIQLCYMGFAAEVSLQHIGRFKCCKW